MLGFAALAFAFSSLSDCRKEPSFRDSSNFSISCLSLFFNVKNPCKSSVLSIIFVPLRALRKDFLLVVVFNGPTLKRHWGWYQSVVTPSWKAELCSFPSLTAPFSIVPLHPDPLHSSVSKNAGKLTFALPVGAYSI